MNKLGTAIGAVALLCASQANAASFTYNEREPNDSIQQAEKLEYAFTPGDQQVVINYFGSLANEASNGADWFAIDIPAISTGVALYTTSIFVSGLNGSSTPDLLVFNLDTNRLVNPQFNSVLAGRYAIGIANFAGVAGGSYRANVVIDAIPEPSTWALMLAGFGMVGYAMRRRRPRVVYA